MTVELCSSAALQRCPPPPETASWEHQLQFASCQTWPHTLSTAQPPAVQRRSLHRQRNKHTFTHFSHSESFFYSNKGLKSCKVRSWRQLAHLHQSQREGTATVRTWQMAPTWEDEEDARHKGQDGALRPDVSDVTDDERSEDEEQRHHREGCGCTHHLCQRRGQGLN